jgi:ribokinase
MYPAARQVCCTWLAATHRASPGAELERAYSTEKVSLMYDVVTFGNAVIDVFLAIHDAAHHCHINEQEQELCIRYGEKIPLDRCAFLLGGNACNVAVGMSRLGFRTGLIAELGGDEFAKKIYTGLQQEGVSTEYLLLTDAPSSFSIALNFAGERTLFVEHIERQHRFVYNGMRTKWLYITSLGTHWHAAYEDILAYARREHIRIAFSPGTPQLHEAGPHVMALLRHSDFLFLNREEAQLLLDDNQPCRSMEELLVSVQGLGPANVVITDGDQGATAIDRHGNLVRQLPIPGPIVEKTGAGDSFASGCLAAILLEQDLSTALLWGSLNAASVIAQVGTQPGLLRRDALLRQAAGVQEPAAIAS